MGQAVADSDFASKASKVEDAVIRGDMEAAVRLGRKENIKLHCASFVEAFLRSCGISHLNVYERNWSGCSKKKLSYPGDTFGIKPRSLKEYLPHMKYQVEWFEKGKFRHLLAHSYKTVLLPIGETEGEVLFLPHNHRRMHPELNTLSERDILMRLLSPSQVDYMYDEEMPKEKKESCAIL